MADNMASSAREMAGALEREIDVRLELLSRMGCLGQGSLLRSARDRSAIRKDDAGRHVPLRPARIFMLVAGQAFDAMWCLAHVIPGDRGA